MRLTIYSLIFCVLLLFLSIETYTQNDNFADKIFRQDSTIINKQKFWIDLGYGPSITIAPEGTDMFILGGSIDFTYINHDYRLIKIKALSHAGVSIFSNFPQASGEINFMTGKIKVISRSTKEFYYGLGLVLGQKRARIISSYGGTGSGFDFSLSWTKYEKKKFIFIGIPFEYKIQWSTFGIGIYGNLNPYLPYLGPKCYFKIGNKYKK